MTSLSASLALPLLTALSAALAGAILWFFLEYWLHRILGHRVGSRLVFTVEHMNHHRDPRTFGPTWMKALTAVPTVLGVGWLGARLGGAAAGIGAATGFALAYVGYELTHRRIHTHAPLTRYGRLLRRHHLAHHFRDRHANQGVSILLWDRLFGTLRVEHPLKVPVKVAPPWMVDPETGALKADYQADYVLVGRASGRVARARAVVAAP